MRLSLTLGLLVAAIVTAGCGGGSGSMPRVSGGGATFVDPIMQKWAGEYRNMKKAEIDYVAKGSGYGVSNLTSKNIDFGCSDAPMSKAELDKAGGEVLHIPVAIGAVAIIYNLEGVPALKLNGEVLAEIYLLKITKWNHPKIVALNPGVPLPDVTIAPGARKESSGTSAIFTEYLSKISPAFAKAPGTSKSPKWPLGADGKEVVAGRPENNGVADYVKSTPGSIGYVELAYAKTNNIAYATMINKAGQPVMPDADSVTAAVDAAMKVKQDKEPYSLHPLAYSFTDADGPKAYPIVGASYAMLFKKQPKDKGPVIVEFLKWAVSDGQKMSAELHYAPLPAELTKKAHELLGTVTFE